MNDDIEPARVKCVIMKETEKALFVFQEPGTQTWIPRSQCSHISKHGKNKRYPEHTDATIEMPEWLAEEKGLDYQ